MQIIFKKKNPFTNINYVSKRTTYRGTTFFRKFPSLKPNISKREIGVRFNGRTVPNLPTYRQIILQGLQSFQTYFPFQRNRYFVVGINLHEEN